jgi:hypothetical protein
MSSFMRVDGDCDDAMLTVNKKAVTNGKAYALPGLPPAADVSEFMGNLDRCSVGRATRKVGQHSATGQPGLCTKFGATTI